MSITIDFLFNYDGDQETLLKDLEGWIGCRFASREDPDDYRFCWLLGMEFYFGEHTLENDGELDVENFQYKISIRTPWSDADFRPLQLMTMASVTYALFRRLSIGGMLVFDTQTLLARYEIRGETLFDHVSNKTVQYPAHFADLIKKI